MARPRRSADTQRRLLTEGVSSFLRNGYHGTGLQQVLQEASVPKGSFYNYFSSKEEFAAAAIRHYADCLGSQHSRAMEGAPDPLTGLRAFFEEMRDDFQHAGFTGGCLVANLGGELEGSEVCRISLQAAQEGFRSGVREALAVAQDRGLLRSDLSPKAMADLLIDAWEGAVIRMKIERSAEPLDHCLNSLLDGYFRS